LDDYNDGDDGNGFDYHNIVIDDDHFAADNNNDDDSFDEDDDDGCGDDGVDGEDNDTIFDVFFDAAIKCR
jgi:hypothetical protein